MTLETPVRCLTCGYTIGDKMTEFIPFIEDVKSRKISDNEKEKLISEKIVGYTDLIDCCRTYFISFIPWVRIIK